MKRVDIISNIVARKGEALATPSKDISKVNLSGYLLKSIWDKVWEIRTDSQGTEYIFGKLPVVTQYGITMYSGDGVDVPSLASGLPFDGRTIWYNPDTKQIEVIGGTGGGSGEGVSNFWDLSGIPSWITNSKPKYTYSEIEGTPDLSKYALVSQIPSLSGYATESWVKNQGYLTEHQDLSGYQPLITSSNKLAYSLVSGTPTSLKNPNALNFGSKSYDGSAKITLTAGDLGALTSHQQIYTLTFQSGKFASASFTANTASKTISIPTTTSHISEGSNLYFTNARAVSALAETLKAYVTLSGNQTITGEKNFTGGLKINGSPIVYNSTKKYWKLEGDLLVTGGVTMYGSDSSFTPSTIMDAIAVDGTTISKTGGVLKVIGGVADSVAWANITGKPTFASVATSGKYSDLSGTPSSLPASDVYSWAKSATKPTYKWSEITSKPTWIGSSKPTYSYSEITGAISTTELQNYLTQNSYLNVTSGDNRYLKLSGGTISGTYGALTIHRTNENSSLIKYSNSSGTLGYLGLNSSKEPIVYKGTDTNTQYKIWYSGNDGEGSGLDADMLDGYNRSSFYSLYGGSTLNASDTNNVDLNTLTSAHSYYQATSANVKYVANKPSGVTAAFRVYVFNPTGTSSTYLRQRIQQYNSDDIYERVSTNSGSTWTDWTLVQTKLSSFTASSTLDGTLSIKLGSLSANVDNLYARTTRFFANQWDYNSGTVFDLNEWSTGGIVRCYGSSENLLNRPDGFAYGNVLSLSNGVKALTGQLAWAVNHNSTTNTTKALWFRASDSANGFTYSQWKQIAFTDSNVASATKLETARTIWGQSFDGTGNVIGTLTNVYSINMQGALIIWNQDKTKDLTINWLDGIAQMYSYEGQYNDILIGASGVSAAVANRGLYYDASEHKWGIGITTPEQTLDVNGTFRATGNVYLCKDSSNRVGIGTTAPEWMFHVVQNTDNTWTSVFETPNSKVYLARSSGRGIYAGVLSGVSTSYLLNLKYNQTTLGNGGSSALYVRTDGNIGIGTESPDYKFHVVGTTHINGDTSFNSSVTLKGTDSTTARIIMSRSSYNYINYPVDGSLCLGTSNASASTQLFIDGATGNVGIGTLVPSAKFHVAGTSHLRGTIYVTNADATTTVEDSGKIKFNSLNTRDDFRSPYIQAIHQGNYSRKRLSIFQSNATNYTDDFVEVFTVLPNGNVGIGTASPSSKLHVSGDILATGGITMYSMRALKNVVDERGLSLTELSTIKPTRYTWKDGRDNRLHFGGIADDIQQVLPEVVYKTNDGILTMDYGNAAFAVASSLIQPVVDHENRIAMLEEENKQLRLEIERLKSA